MRWVVLLHLVSERLKRSLGSPIVLAEHESRATASMGSSMYSEDDVTKDSLLYAADAAIYTEKNIRRQTNARNST
jgi:GGDEF domain-containing protein